MPAEYESGFSVREPMWHGLGVVLPENPDWDEVGTLAGFPSEVQRVDFYYADPAYEGEGHKLLAAEGVGGLINPDTGAYICHATDTYGIVQPQVMLDVLEALAGEGAYVETAGVLRGGRQHFAMAKLDEEFMVPGDDSPYLPYISIHNSFDGSLAFQAARHAIRVVCANTQDAALRMSENYDTNYKWKHSSGVMSHVEEAKEVMFGMKALMDEFIELCTEMTNKRVTPEGRGLFLERLVPMPPPALVTDRAAANVFEAREAVLSILNGETGTVQPSLGLTSYGLYIAGNEYLDYVRPARSKETMFSRAILTPQKAKKSLVKMAMEVGV